MKITGAMYRDMVISAACSLENDKETINNLNVFPVPDGDTGINMSLTMSGVRGDYSKFEAPLGETAQKAANLMLRGARGNSGVILSLFFRGIAKAWKEQEEADCELVLKGFSKAGGMETILNRLGADREQTMAIGDSTNDLPMFALAAHSVCLGNGAEEAKAVCEYVTADVMDDGIEKALIHYGLI